MTTLEEIADALGVAGVFEGQPSARLEFAGTLLCDGVTPEQVEILAAWVDRTMSEAKRAAGLRNVLAQTHRRKEVLADLERLAAARASKGAVLAPGEAQRIKPKDPGEWDHIDRARRVAARVDSDHKDLGAVADEFGISVQAAEQLLAHGRSLKMGALK